MQDPNGEFLTLKSRTNSINGKQSCKIDLDGSYSSDKHRQSKMEKLEMEISKLLERNDGKLFVIKQERYGVSKDEGKYDDYTNDGSCLDAYYQG